MVTLAAYLFIYGRLLLTALVVVSGFVAWRSDSFRRGWLFRSLLVVFSTVMLASAFYSPIVITSPDNHTMVHPGQLVPLRVEVRPAVLGKLFPWVNLDIYRCYTCTDAPSGVVTQGTLTGSPYTFYITLPQNLPAGEIYVNAYAAMRMGEHAALRSNGVGLVVK